MDNVTLAKIYDKIEKEHLSFKELSQSLNMDLEDIFEGMADIVNKEIVLHVDYLMDDEMCLSEDYKDALQFIKERSNDNIEIQSNYFSDRIEDSNDEFGDMIESFNTYCEENIHGLIAASFRDSHVSLEDMVKCYEGRFTREEIIALVKKAVVENHIKTDVTHLIPNAENEEEREELLFIQNLSDQIEKPVVDKVEYVPIGQKLASGRLQGICGSYAEYIDPMYMDEVIKCMRFQKIENICEAYDIKYEPGISGEEICAGIYLYLLSQDYRQIQNIKFFASPYVALEFYMKRIQPNNDITVFYDIGIFDD